MALAALFPLGCVTQPEREPPERQPRQVALETFRELLEAGEVRPASAGAERGRLPDAASPSAGSGRSEAETSRLEGGGGGTTGPPGSTVADEGEIADHTPRSGGGESPPETASTAAAADGSGAVRPPAGAEENPAGTGPQAGAGAQEAPPFNPWREFGARILWDPQTRLVTKPYPIRVGSGEKVLGLCRDYGGFREYDPKSGPQGPDTVHFDLQKEYDAESLSADLRGKVGAPFTRVPLADWLFVTASPERLRDFEYFLDTFFASPPQIEIEAKIVEVVLRDDFDVGIRDFLAVLPERDFVDTLAFNFPNTSGGAEFLTSIGAIQDGTTYSAILEALATLENVSITSRPRSVVREGARARIESIDRIPFLQLTTVNASGGFNTQLQWQEVGVRLYVTPRLLGSHTVSLEIDIEASQQTGNAVTVQTASGDDVTTPILSTRLARTQVYLHDGQAVILGGLIAERAVDNVRKLPMLGDLPGIGWFFRSTFQSSERTQILFFIRPRVIEGSDLAREF